MGLTVSVDGAAHALTDEHADQSLLRVLRDELGIVAPKNACEQGECGSCTILLEGEIVCACLVTAAQAAGKEVETVTSVARANERLHPLQQALLENGAVQCGFCTPGIVMAARDLLRRIPEPTDEDIREGLAGNLCRCTGYQKILEAVRQTAGA